VRHVDTSCEKRVGHRIVKQIVEVHGGRIWVASTLGSTFQMELPTGAEYRKGGHEQADPCQRG